MVATFKKIIIIILIFLVLVSCSFVAGIFFQRSVSDSTTQQVTARTIVNRINNEAIVLSKTVYLNQKATIKVDTGSDWSNFWWGQTIVTEGMIRVDLGVDYKKLTEQDIKVDPVARKITLKLPVAEVLDASLSGDIKVVTQNGVLKFLLANDPNQDHNLAQKQMIEDAKEAVLSSTNPNLMVEARNDSVQVVKLVLEPLGYQVEVS